MLTSKRKKTNLQEREREREKDRSERNEYSKWRGREKSRGGKRDIAGEQNGRESKWKVKRVSEIKRGRELKRGQALLRKAQRRAELREKHEAWERHRRSVCVCVCVCVKGVQWGKRGVSGETDSERLGASTRCTQHVHTNTHTICTQCCCDWQAGFWMWWCVCVVEEKTLMIQSTNTNG